MKSHGRIKLMRMAGAFILTALLSGCQLSPGMPHPFTTMFQKHDLAYRLDHSEHEPLPVIVAMKPQSDAVETQL